MDVFMMGGNWGDFKYDTASSKKMYSLCAVLWRSTDAWRQMMRAQMLSTLLFFLDVSLPEIRIIRTRFFLRGGERPCDHPDALRSFSIKTQSKNLNVIILATFFTPAFWLLCYVVFPLTLQKARLLLGRQCKDKCPSISMVLKNWNYIPTNPNRTPNELLYLSALTREIFKLPWIIEKNNYL